jgi:Dolichol kinase
MNGEKSLLILSVFYTIAVIGVGLLLYGRQKMGSETARKFIHAGVSNWIIFWYYGIRSLSVSLFFPILFIVLNSIFVFTPLKRLLGLKDAKRDMGLVYYPLALGLVILLAYYSVISREIALGAVLALGYGDAAAAIVGIRLGKHRYTVFGNAKSAEGSLAMFLVLAVIGCITVQPSAPALLLIALVPTFFEAVTPFGLDNLTIPLSFAYLAVLV